MIRARTLPLLLVLGALLADATAAAAAAPADSRRPFAPPGTPRQYAPARSYDLQHLRLDLAFDWDNREVSGTATSTLVPLLPGLRSLVFHAVDLDVRRIRLAGGEADLPFTLDPVARTLTVDLGRAYGPQDRIEVVIDYAAKPKAGLYFVGPDRSYPDKPRQIWSQNEPELGRHWFPSWDYPNDRATTELLATVSPPFQVIGNGRLVEVLDRPDGRRTYHWSMEQPHTSYLFSVVAGEFTRVADDWRGIPVEYYVPPRWADRARRSFGRTPRMMEYFSTVTGRSYPYAKYAQTTVADFTWGGMENISATTQTLRTLHDERAHNDASSDSLVAHELAHQWFGGLVTCEDWSHLWLNEGMADYFTLLYLAHAGGVEEMAVELESFRRTYLREDSRYRRPIVTDRYPAPITLFDNHSYEKGALVLRMIHGLLGDEGWWKGIRAYLDRFALQTVKTPDFQSVLEETTGVTLGPLFDQYVYGAGHPELAVRWDYLADRKLVRLSVRQTQEVTGETGLFSFPVEIGLVGDAADAADADDGGMEIQKVEILPRAEQEIYLPSPKRPRTVVFDPRDWALAIVDFDKPTAEWLAQLKAGAGADTPARLEALRALGELADAPAVEALAAALRQDPFYGARQIAAEALGKAGTEAARRALAAGAGDRDSRVRTLVLEALGSFPHDRESLPLLRRALEGDDSYRVRAAAAAALGTRRDAAREVTPWLVRALSQESHDEDVRAAAIQALAALEAPVALDHAFRLAAYGAPAESRDEAAAVLAQIAARRQDPELRARVRRTLEGILAERDSRMRNEAMRALAELGDPEAVLALERAGRTDPEPEIRWRAGQLADRIRRQAAAGEPAGEPAGDDSLRLRVEQLEREIDVLKARLEEAPQQEGATGAPPPPSP